MYISHDVFFSPRRRLTKALHPSAPAPVALSTLRTHCDPTSQNLAHPCSKVRQTAWNARSRLAACHQVVAPLLPNDGPSFSKSQRQPILLCTSFKLGFNGHIITFHPSSSPLIPPQPKMKLQQFRLNPLLLRLFMLSRSRCNERLRVTFSKND